MARFVKTLVPCGVHHSPQGRVEVTRDRVRRWVEQWRKMRSGGVKIPIPWGHRRDSVPKEGEEDDEEEAYRAARYNAGYILDLRQGPDGSLVMVGEAPALAVDAKGNLIDPELRTAISEVSAGIGDWRDGRGKVWRDVIVHAALTPLPVWAGQDSFRELSSPPSLAGVFWLGTATAGGTMKTDAKNLKKTPSPKKGFTGKGLANDVDEELDLDDGSLEDGGDELDLDALDMGDEDTGDESGDEDMSDDEVDADEMGDDDVDLEAELDGETDDMGLDEDMMDVPAGVIDEETLTELMAGLDEIGISLPAGTSPENFMDRFIATVSVLRGLGARVSTGGGDDDYEMDEPATAESGVEEEAAPALMMSTLGSLSPRAKKQAQSNVDQHRRKVHGEIKRVAQTLGMTKAEYKKLSTDWSRQVIRVNPETLRPVKTRFEHEFAGMKSVSRGVGKKLKKAFLSTRGASASENPAVMADRVRDAKGAGDAEFQQKLAEAIFGKGAKFNNNVQVENSPGV